MRADGTPRGGSGTDTALDVAVGGVAATATDSLEVLDAFFHHSPLALAVYDRRGCFVRVNDAFAALDRVRVADHVGRRLVDVLPQLPEAVTALDRVLLTGEPVVGLELAGPPRAGAASHWRAAFFPLRADGLVVGVGMTVEDLAAGAAGAGRDPLTGLPGRALFMDRLAHALRARDRDATGLAVLAVTLDGVRAAADDLGSAAADAAVREVARRLSVTVRPGDTVARLGDGFVLLCTGVTDEVVATHLAERVLDAVRVPVAADGDPVSLDGGVGVALAASAERDAAALLAAAGDAARGRRGGVALHDPGLRGRARARLEEEHALRLALEAGEVELSYQPVVRLTDGAIVALRARPHWPHQPHQPHQPHWASGDEGPGGPDRLAALAADPALAAELSRYVLQAACRQAVDWLRPGGGVRVQLSVALSAADLGRPELPLDVAATLAQAGLPGPALSLEASASALVDAPGASEQTLRDLSGLGVTLAVDGFGTRYSALDRLRRLPVDVLQLDRGFVADLSTRDGDGGVVGSVVGLAHALGVRALADGVDTPRQVVALRRLGCDLGAGAALGSPVPAAEARLVAARGRITVLR